MNRWVVTAVVCLSGVASAQALPGGATLSFGPLVLPAGATTPAAQYFNFAHCSCSQPGAAPGYVEGSFAYQLMLTQGTMAVHRPLEIWVGAGCDDATTRASSCHRITSATIADLSTIPPAGVAPSVPVYDLMEPQPGSNTCEFRAMASGEWAIADGNGDGTLDTFVGQPIMTDAKAPPLPTGFAAQIGNGTIDLTWTPPADLSDIVAYQVLCATQAGDPGSTLPPPAAAAYETAHNLCGEALNAPLVPNELALEPAGSADANSDVVIPQGIAQLDPALMCASVTDPTATSMHIANLTRTQPLVMLFLAIDAAGNPAATYFYPTITADAPPPGAGCGCTTSEPGAAALPLVLVMFGLSGASAARARSRRVAAGATGRGAARRAGCA